MADSESSITNSSLTHSSTTHTSLLDSVPNRDLSSDRDHRCDRRASLGLIDAARMRLSMDLHTLLRFNSKSQRIQTVLSTQAEDPESEHLVYPNYAKVSSHIVDLEVRSMDATVEERPGRSGFGARIVNFLNRSRSRSRSKKRRSCSLDAYTVEPMPDTVHTASLRVHARHSSFEHDQDGAIPGPSRPMSRSPSRPLSRTTTATNAVKRRPKVPEQIIVAPAPSATGELVAQLVPIEPTPSNPSRKGRRINIFGILLPSPRKGSFSESLRGRSRPTTPSPAAPEQPWQGSEGHTLTEQSGSQRSQRSTRKGLPMHIEEPAVPCLPPRTTAEGTKGLVLPNLISPQPRSIPIHILNGTSAHRDQFVKPENIPDAESVDGRCSPLCGLGTSSKGSHTSQEKGKERERMRGARDRSGERGTRGGEKEREGEKERITHPRRVGSPLQRVRESTSAVAVAAVPLQKSSSGRSATSGNKDHYGHPHPRSGAEGLVARAKRIKHGSFDFERPVSSGVSSGGGVSIKATLQTMGIGEAEQHPLNRSNSARGVPVRRPIYESHQNGFAPSSLPKTRGMPDKGKKPVHFADLPSRQPPDHSMSTTAYPHAHLASHAHSRGNGAMYGSQSNHGHRREPSPASPMSTSSGESSAHPREGSWGRSGEKRIVRGSHGLFKFEPAVPPIPGSPADNERKAAPRSSSRPTSPSPLPSSGPPMLSNSKQARAAGKGRSMDLGLGLTWAPSKVREEAVLRVGGPRSGMSSSTSSMMRAHSQWRGADEEGRLAAGTASDVAQAFKEVLGDAAYRIFKNYVHRFDANAIPLDGPYGLLAHIERLLDNAPGVDYRRKRVLLERFRRVVQDSEPR